MRMGKRIFGPGVVSLATQLLPEPLDLGLRTGECPLHGLERFQVVLAGNVLVRAWSVVL
jgi:hypothetical protein